MLIAITLIVAGLVGVAAGFPLAHRWSGLPGVLAATAVVAGIAAALGGIILLIVPSFFIT